MKKKNRTVHRKYTHLPLPLLWQSSKEFTRDSAPSFFRISLYFIHTVKSRLQRSYSSRAQTVYSISVSSFVCLKQYVYFCLFFCTFFSILWLFSNWVQCLWRPNKSLNERFAKIEATTMATQLAIAAALNAIQIIKSFAPYSPQYSNLSNFSTQWICCWKFDVFRCDSMARSNAPISTSCIPIKWFEMAIHRLMQNSWQFNRYELNAMKHWLH